MAEVCAQRALTGKNVATICAAFFLVIVSVNASLAWFAISTNSGEVAQEPYRKGLHYNDRIAKDAEQTKSGWNANIQISDDASKLRVLLRDRDGSPIRNLRITGVVSRPTTRAGEAQVAFSENEDGSYSGSVTLLPGSYIADIAAYLSNDKTILFRGRQRLWLKP